MQTEFKFKELIVHHDHRFITTNHPLEAGEDFEGQIIASMRDCEGQAQYARLFAAAPELLKAAIAMDKLMENLWDSVPWGKTFGLDVKALNETPLLLKRATAKAGFTPVPQMRRNQPVKN